MKKPLLSIFAVMLMGVAFAQGDAEKQANQIVSLENNRVGGTLTEDQQKAIYDAYFKTFSLPADERNMGEPLKVVRATLTDEQKAARAAYFESRKKK